MSAHLRHVRAALESVAKRRPIRAHSPSSLDLGARCRRAWWYRYRCGMREPEIDWRDIVSGRTRIVPWGGVPRYGKDPKHPRECTLVERAVAIGKYGHGILENWYRGKRADWSSLPGQIAAAAQHHLPSPKRCGVVRIEQALGTRPSGATHGPGTILDVDGVPLWGKKDLVVHSGDECTRLFAGSSMPARLVRQAWLLADYKFCGSIDERAKLPAELLDDVACNLYGLDVMLREDLRAILARWLYMETKKVRRSLPVDVIVERSRAEDIIGPACELARELAAMTCEDDAPQNPLACADYGGCPRHMTKGGPCDAIIPSHILIYSRPRKEDRPMPVGSTKESVEDRKARLKAAAEEGDGTEPTAKAPAAKPSRSRSKAKAPPDADVEKLEELVDELKAAKANTAKSLQDEAKIKAKIVDLADHE